MPEKPEVITDSKSLEKRIIGKKIQQCHVYWDNIIVGDTKEFEQKIQNLLLQALSFYLD